eukprot:CAMPEP_0184669530 /NCGR_PEP_ID=MMETSP0308-20130426/77897_1 /TAXON_ID=38269 /ORGANISM="Gloeochaete witrockiana, Strain SAG 46.84" /LENGTH=43 /DNA_ID= /DNA_START= /DNA_END= /DNA_ORIENTATION=
MTSQGHMTKSSTSVPMTAAAPVDTEWYPCSAPNAFLQASYVAK